MQPILAYVGLGSNEGDRERHLGTALDALAATPGIEVLRASTRSESSLVGDGPPQGPFLNAVAELRTLLSPVALLGIFKALEARAGRRLPAARNHPRPLDLDLLAYGEESIDTAELVVPHRLWREREFVTVGLAELGVDTANWPRGDRTRLIGRVDELVDRCTTWLVGGCEVGLVPTMGALHDGHRRLIDRARAECDRVVVSVFVNPLQFGAGEDLAAYPRFPERDLEICRLAGVDAVFAPSAAEMYPAGFCSRIAVGRTAASMEGAVRPDHFAGVVTVVARLFALIRPKRAYFGEKDAQQLAVIRRLVTDLGFPVRVVGCPIVREADGLAMSSRNVYLEPSDRAASTVLFRALVRARQAFRAGDRDRDALIAVVSEVIRSEPRVAVDYIELRREGELEPLPPGIVQGGRMLVAARLLNGTRPVRLIDNMSLGAGHDGEVIPQ